MALVNLFVFKGDYGLVRRLLQFENPNLVDAGTRYTVVPIASHRWYDLNSLQNYSIQ
jgi:hypothetical protein